MKKKLIGNFFRDSLLKNSIYLMATSFITGTIGFFFWVIAARYYSPNDIGITSAMFSSISLISMIGSLGLTRTLTFYLPRDNNNRNKIISSCLAINIISSIFFSIIFILGLKVWSPKLLLVLENIKHILIFIIITAAISVTGIIGSALTAGRRSSFQMLKEITYHIIKILPLFFLVNFGALGILLSLGIGLILSIILGFFLLFKTWKYIPNLTLDPIIKNIASFSTGNYIADIFNGLPGLIFSIIILNTISASSAGYFYIAMMMAGLLYGISISISSSFLVESSDKDKFWKNVNKSIKFNILILIPGLFFFTILGKFVLNFFNPSYAENAYFAMIILALTSIPLSIVNIFNTVRNAQNKVISMVKMNMLIAIISIILSTYLIKFNIEGIAVSYLVAYTIGVLIVINRIKNPKEFGLKLLNEIKNDILLYR